MLDAMKSKSKPAAVEKKSGKHVAGLLRQIKAAHKQGFKARADEMTREYLRSFDARYVAALDAWKRMPVKKRPPKSELPQIAAELDAWRGTSEPVQVYFKEKKDPNSDFRITMDFGIRNRALQNLVLAVLKARSKLHDHQFFTRGGVNAAINLAVKALHQGFVYSVQLDIQSCFTSFVPEALPHLLPLPKEVTRNIITTAHHNLTPGNFVDLLGTDAWANPSQFLGTEIGQYILAARSGLPQGSAASPLVSEMLLASVMCELNARGFAIAYADNFLLMAKDANGASDMEQALRSALKSHLAGPLTPSWTITNGPYQPFDFLGYQLRPTKHGEVSIKPSNSNLEKFHSKFHDMRRRIEKASHPYAISTRKHECRGYVKAWVAGFPLWADGKEFLSKQLARIEAL